MTGYHISKPYNRPVWKNHKIVSHVTMSRIEADKLNGIQKEVYYGFTDEEFRILETGSRTELIDTGLRRWAIAR